jgi:predicted amidophosphoribosyltransferase
VDSFVRRLGQRCGLPVWPLLVRRTSASQKSLDREHRLVNARSSYALASGAARRLAGVPAVWLVDDVVTTGATVEACSRLLLEAGAGEVRVFCLGLH